MGVSRWGGRRQQGQEAAGLGGCGSRRQQEQEAAEAGGRGSGRQQKRKREAAGVGGSSSGMQQERETAVGEVVGEFGTRSLPTGIYSQLAELPAVGWAWVVVLNVTFIHSRNKSENVTVLASR